MISICMAYFNRKPQLYKTLRTIEQSQLDCGEYEIIIVDDSSEEEHKLDGEFLAQFNIDIKLIAVSQEEKTWLNPCMPFNIAFRAAKGDKIIIQSPEVLHLGDVLSYTKATLKPNDYAVHQILALCHRDTELLKDVVSIKELQSIIDPIARKTLHIGSGPTLWYVHPIYRKKYYHFLTAMHREDLLALGGFDERYQHDSAYDDDEFFTRIQRKKMRLNMVTGPIGVHQFHPNFDFKNKGPGFRKKNRDLLINHTRKEKTICPQPLSPM